MSKQSLMRVPGWLAGLIGVVTPFVLWAVVAVAGFPPDPGTGFTPVPPPWTVLSEMAAAGPSAFWDGVLRETLMEASIGFLWGNLIALLLASLVLLVPWLEPVIMQIAVTTYCLPVVAVGGISIVVLGGAEQPGDPSKTSIFLAALMVFFTTVVGAVLGFKSADHASLDVVRVYGGSVWTQLVKVRLVAAVPAILNALQIAVPTAILGAVLGEYLGSTDRGVGRTLIVLQGKPDPERLWAVFLVCALVALAGYLLLGLVSRLVTPWVAGRSG